MAGVALKMVKVTLVVTLALITYVEKVRGQRRR